MTLRRITCTALAAGLLLLTNGCLYSKVTRPLDDNVSETVLGSKIGRASSQGVMFLVAWGDSGVAAAAKNGGLTTVNHLDVESLVVFFGAYARITTIAYGD